MLTRFRSFLVEKDTTFAPQPATSFHVDYLVVTPKGSRSRFRIQTGLSQINNARSETAVLAYLRRRHPGTDVLIYSLDFK